MAKEANRSRLPEFSARFDGLRGKMSRVAFADYLGISRQTVGFYCNGERLPDAAMLRTIAERCGVSADWLLGITDDRRIVVSGIADKIRSMSDEQLVAFLDGLMRTECDWCAEWKKIKTGKPKRGRKCDGRCADHLREYLEGRE